MPAPERSNDPRAARARRRVRTDGSPRLVAPRTPGNPSGFWYVLWVERTPAGASRSRRWSTGTSDENLAKEQFVRWKAARTRPPDAVTVERIVAGYLDALDSAHAAKIKSKLRAPREAFGPLHPDEITPGFVRQYVRSRTKDERMRAAGVGTDVVARGGTVSRSTVSGELAYLTAALNWARKEKWISEVPFLKQPGGMRPRKRRLSQAEAGRLFEALRDARTPAHVRALVTLGLLTGQRAGHLRALRWRDVDFEGGMLWFSRSNPDAADNKRVADVPMAPALAAFLSVLKQGARTEWVIEYRDAPVASIKTAWRALLKRAELEDVRFHDLRRSAASFALNGGASLTQVAAFIADDEETARRHYAHANPQLLAAVVNKIAAAVVPEAPESDPIRALMRKMRIARVRAPALSSPKKP